MTTRRTLLAVALCAGAAATLTAGPARAATPPDPYGVDLSRDVAVTILASRAERTSAVPAGKSCTPDPRGTRYLGTQAARLYAQGIPLTVSVQTGATPETGYGCTHHSTSTTLSWQDLSRFAATWGTEVVSHTDTYPSRLDTLTDDEAYAETCGSAQKIEAHNLKGARGLIAYPGVQAPPTRVQETFGQRCFDYARTYGNHATTSAAQRTTAPYWQSTGAPNGGPCNTPGLPCSTVTATGSSRYVLPSQVIGHVEKLQPGDWWQGQFYLLVTGTSPVGSPVSWDCTSADPRLHWSTDNERYCARDFDLIVAALRKVPHVRFTTPAAIGAASGRNTAPGRMR